MEEPRIIYETENFLAINKPAGLMVHPVRISEKRREAAGEGRQAEPTLVDWLIEHRPEVRQVGDDPAMRPGIVHRLDKDTSGVMVIPKNQKYFEYLKSLFQSHRIHKTYYAVVIGVPKRSSGVINLPIGIKTGTLKRSVHSVKMQKEAITKYKVVKSFSWPGASSSGAGSLCSLLEIHPETGRTHQIRVHLASIGNPIIGDRLYGPKAQRFPSDRLMLHAAEIEFSEENSNKIVLEAELPESFGGK